MRSISTQNLTYNYLFQTLWDRTYHWNRVTWKHKFRFYIQLLLYYRPLSLETKINTSHSLDTSGVFDTDGDEDQGQMDIRLSDSPITISHLLNISPEPFIAPREPSQLFDHCATPFSCDLTTTPSKSRVPSPLYSFYSKTNQTICHAQYLQLSESGLEGMIDAAFLDIINPDILIDMESLEVHSTPLESTNEPITYRKLRPCPQRMQTFLLSWYRRSSSSVDHCGRSGKRNGPRHNNPPNSSHKSSGQQIFYLSSA
ncbi:hypothetical protein BJ912DRAFT_7199 [Pholiota molesta]|nr:hypothetical protein BJ912DRAFT_7199 [Pholiota molesta]